MKPIRTIIGVAAITLSAFTLSGCSDFLSPEPESIYSTETFYTSESDFQYAINGVYSVMKECYDEQDGYLHFLEARCDNTSSDRTNMYDDGAAGFTDNAGCGPTEKMWKYMYQIISRTNSILVRIDNVQFTNPTLKNSIKGEAYGMRAWAYETLGKFFGGVPLLVDKEYSDTEARKVKRSTQEETFNQAVSDYQKAIELLPESWNSDNAGRMTRYAADGALGRLYMFMNQPAQARPYLEAVINSGIYQMAESYDSCFNDKYDNDPKCDRLWEVQYIGGQSTEGQSYSEMDMPEDCGIQEGYAVRGTSAAMQVSLDLAGSFEKGDYRKTAFTSDNISGSLAKGYTWCIKFNYHTYVATKGDDWANNLPVIRYTDVIMLEAEAINATEGPTATAVGYINQVRKRAHLPELTAEQTASKEAFLNVIKHERRVEFMWEGQRWFDLVRWGDMVDVMKNFFKDKDNGNGRFVNNVASYRTIFAIPQAEMERYGDTSVLWQNEGY